MDDKIYECFHDDGGEDFQVGVARDLQEWRDWSMSVRKYEIELEPDPKKRQAEIDIILSSKPNELFDYLYNGWGINIQYLPELSEERLIYQYLEDGYCSASFAYSDNEQIRKEVAENGYALDLLIFDESPAVAEAAFFSLAYCFSNSEDILKNGMEGIMPYIEAWSKNNPNKKVISDISDYGKTKNFIAYGLIPELDRLVDSPCLEDNIEAIRIGYGLDKAVQSPSAEVRSYVANVGRDEDLDILVHDRSDDVRYVVASKGRDKDLNILVHDNDEEVRAMVTSHARPQDLYILTNKDEHPVVLAAIVATGENLDILHEFGYEWLDFHIDKYIKEQGYTNLNHWEDMNVIEISDIQWDVNNKVELEDLPQKVYVPLSILEGRCANQDKIDDTISEYLSFISGYCHKGFKTNYDNDPAQIRRIQGLVEKRFSRFARQSDPTERYGNVVQMKTREIGKKH